MREKPFCPQCQQLLPPDAPEGLCPSCVLKNLAVTQGQPPGSAASDAAGVDIGNAAVVAARLPQFEIIELLGRGGMGVVYKARQIQLDRVVALKILPPVEAAQPDFAARFLREARALAKLSHPNIVGVYDFGECGGLYFFTMEYVDGANLRQIIQNRRLDPAEALDIIPKICDALQFAHEEGVMHRDIKPENILLDRKGRVKIADFGLAKLLGRDAGPETMLTLSGMTLGTPRYMAPEQIEKPESVDHRADIYSLGVVFYEMLTGELPMGRFALPSERVQVDVRLDEIVLRSLEKDVQRRYQHASEVKSDLESVASSSKSPSAAAASPPVKSRQHKVPSAAPEELRKIRTGAELMIIAGVVVALTGLAGAIYGGVVSAAAKNKDHELEGRAGSAALACAAYFGCGIFALNAGLAMKRLRSHWLARAGAYVLIALPCSLLVIHAGTLGGKVFFQFMFSLAVGLGTLRLLRQESVEAAFGGAAQRPQPALSSSAVFVRLLLWLVGLIGCIAFLWPEVVRAVPGSPASAIRVGAMQPWLVIRLDQAGASATPPDLLSASAVAGLCAALAAIGLFSLRKTPFPENSAT